MPVHEYTCPSCKDVSERLVRMAKADEQFCRLPVDDEQCVPIICGAKLVRTEISMPQRGKVDVRFRMKAIMDDGRKVEGQFGRSERINKGSM